MTLHAADFADTVIATERKRERPKVSNIAQTLRDYPTVQQLLKKKRRLFRGGRGIEVNLFDALGSTADHVGLLDAENPQFKDHLTQMTTPWVHSREYYMMEYRMDVLMNRGEEKLVDIMKVREAAAMISLIEEIEDKLWEVVAVGDSDNPRGIPYWIVTNATEGFNGGHPGSHTSIGGVDVAVHPNFKNYTDTYTDIVKLDSVKKTRRMLKKIKWRSPVTLAEYRTQDDMRLLMNTETLLSHEDLAQQQNQNLRADLAMYDGSTVIKKIPLTDVPQLDADTTNPIFAINFGTFKFAALRGDFFRRTAKDGGLTQPNVTATFIWLTYNGVCYDRRRNGVIYYAA
jgi:hypothetical protein